MDIVSLIIQVVSGAAGGSAAASLIKDKSLGQPGNALAGLVGGALVSEILNSALATSQIAATTSLDVGTILSQIASGGIGGAILMILVGAVRSAVAK